MIRAFLVGTIALMAGDAVARHENPIVDPATAVPFSAAVAEQVGREADHPIRVVESTSSAGVLKPPCAGSGEQRPNLANTSRQSQASEDKTCAQNGKELLEVKILYDGTVVASGESGEYVLPVPQVWQLLAKEVPVQGELQPTPGRNWSDIGLWLSDPNIYAKEFVTDDGLSWDGYLVEQELISVLKDRGGQDQLEWPNFCRVCGCCR